MSTSSAAYLIGRKIANEGTDVYSNKREGIDIEEATKYAFEDRKGLAKIANQAVLKSFESWGKSKRIEIK